MHKTIVRETDYFYNHEIVEIILEYDIHACFCKKRNIVLGKLPIFRYRANIKFDISRCDNKASRDLHLRST